MTLRHFLSWKPLFYDGLIPLGRRIGPARLDGLITRLGRLTERLWPPRRREWTAALKLASASVTNPWNVELARDRLAENWFRYLARDCTLQGTSAADLAERFDVAGLEHVQEFWNQNRGVIVLGSHFGGHLAALHWLYRQTAPIRALVQRPTHVSKILAAKFDLDQAPHSQSALFVRRGLTASEAVERVLRARSALRDGLAVYLAGDVPWPGPNARLGRLLGVEHAFQTIWIDLAVLAKTPVVLVFCRHLPGGRFSIAFDPPWTISPGEEDLAFARYLARLESEISRYPGEAVAYLSWPCYRLNTSPKRAMKSPHVRLKSSTLDPARSRRDGG